MCNLGSNTFMKFWFQFILGSAVFFYQCSTRKIQDDTSRNEDSVAPLIERYEDPESQNYATNAYEGSDSTLIAIDYGVEQIATDCEAKTVRSLSASFSGYENSADATYYFDSLYALSYCTATWSSEGTSGNYAYYFRNDSLVAAKEDNFYNDSNETIMLVTGFTPLYGYTRNDGTDVQEDARIRYLRVDDYNSKQKDVTSEFSRLINRIRDNQDSVSITDELVTIHIENIVNYGEDFIETEHFEIDKDIFDALIKN
jgi:hypothetical protein